MRSRKSAKKHGPARPIAKSSTSPSPFTYPGPIPATRSEIVSAESRLPESRADSAEIADQIPVIPTAGGPLGDGVFTELIQGEAAAKPPRLLVWDGNEMEVVQHFSHGGLVYVPTQLDPTIVSAVRMPRGAVDYGSTRDLFNETAGLVLRVAGLSNREVTLLTFFIFATWVTECLPLAPFLWVFAPPTASITPLMQLLGLLCRRCLLVDEFTLAALRSLPMQLKLTMMTEVSSPTRSFFKALRASNRRGTYVPASDELLDLFCAKVVFANDPLLDPSVAGFPIEISLPPTREHISRMSSAEAERVAAEFQSKFAMYRLLNYGKVTAPSLDLSEFTAPLREIVESLAACIVGDDDLQSQIVPILKPFDREFRINLTTLLRSIILDALLAACHALQRVETLSVVDLTGDGNTILVKRGETKQVTPEEVGWQLRALGFRTAFIAGGRKGLALIDETREAIHRQAAAYGVRTLLQGTANSVCRHCAALGLPSN